MAAVRGEALSHPSGINGFVTVSIGVAMVIPGSSLTLLFKEADETLYLAKHKGRDRYILGRSCAWANPVSLSAVG